MQRPAAGFLWVCHDAGRLLPTHGAYPDAIRIFSICRGVRLTDLEKADGYAGGKRFYERRQVSRHTRDTGSTTCWGGREGSWMRLRSRSIAAQASSCKWHSTEQMALGKFI